MKFKINSWLIAILIIMAIAFIIKLLEKVFGVHVVFIGALALIPIIFAWSKYWDYKYKKKLKRYHKQFKK
jgi:Flp pilus assembly protein TadB